MDNTIYVTNRSSQVSDGQVQAMVGACAKQIAQHIAPLHFVLPVPVLFLEQGVAGPSTQARIITVEDTLDDAQALGYHTQDGSEHIWGVVGTQAAMSHGAQALTGPYAISTILSHEVAEMFMDPFCSMWADNGHGLSIAFEIGDPVQSDTYDLDGVAVSNFVTGPWFNPMAARTDRFDYMNNLAGPFTMSKGGYWVQMQDGRTSQKFGADMPQWLREVKSSRAARTQRIKTGMTSVVAAV
jgi:hypothetical protein